MTLFFYSSPSVFDLFFVSCLLLNLFRMTLDHIKILGYLFWALSGVVLVVKNLPARGGDVRDAGSVPESGKSPGGGHGNPLQYSCPENPLDREAWPLQSIGSQRVRHDWSDLACTCSRAKHCQVSPIWPERKTWQAFLFFPCPHPVSVRIWLLCSEMSAKVLPVDLRQWSLLQLCLVSLAEGDVFS